MTLKELKALPFIYNFGYTAEDHGLRRYVNEEHGIAKQLYTPRKISTGEWGNGETTFKLLKTGEEFKTVEELLAAINKEKNA